MSNGTQYEGDGFLLKSGQFVVWAPVYFFLARMASYLVADLSVQLAKLLHQDVVRISQRPTSSSLDFRRSWAGIGSWVSQLRSSRLFLKCCCGSPGPPIVDPVRCRGNASTACFIDTALFTMSINATSLFGRIKNICRFFILPGCPNGSQYEGDGFLLKSVWVVCSLGSL